MHVRPETELLEPLNVVSPVTPRANCISKDELHITHWYAAREGIPKTD